MKKKFLAGLAIILLLVGMVLTLSGCAGSDKPKLYVYNWGDYIDESVIDDFEKEYNVDVIYEAFATN